MNERELRALAAFVDLPAERDLAPAVRARLAARPRRRRAVAVVLAALVLAARGRLRRPTRALGDPPFFHLRGARIELVDRLPEVRTPAPLDLGVPVPLAEAAQTAGFEPLDLEPARPARPRHLGRGDGSGSRTATCGCSSRSSAGASGSSWSRSSSSRRRRSRRSPSTAERGYFLSGATHFLYLAPTDLIREERVRLARNVLLWQRGPLTLRLEGEVTLARALEIARSLR